MKLRVKHDRKLPGCFTIKAFFHPAVQYQGYTVEEAKAHYLNWIREGGKC